MEKGLARFRVSLLCFCCCCFAAAGLLRLLVAACCCCFAALFCCAEVADSRRRSFPLRGSLPFSGANASCGCLPPQRCGHSNRVLVQGPCPQVLQRHPGVAKGTSIDPLARGLSTEPLLGQGHVARLSGTGVKPVSCRCFGRTSARHPLREASRWHPGVARQSSIGSSSIKCRCSMDIEVRIGCLSMKCRCFMEVEVRMGCLSMKCRCSMDIEVRIGCLYLKCRCFMDVEVQVP